MVDVAIVGGGIAGMATAARLQARGLSTIVLESHGQPGGCAGYFRRKQFSFDVGATTLVDFEPGGVGGEFLEWIGMDPIDGERLPGYVAWLPDRSVTLHRDPKRWAAERLRAFGSTAGHRAFWRLLDRLAEVFWRASRNGIKLPIRSCADAAAAARAIGLGNLPLVRYINWTLADALRTYGLDGDRPLAGLLGMLVEDTVHAKVADAPLINAALGITIRGAGLTRARGGMRGFWKGLLAHYLSLGGTLRTGCPVYEIERHPGNFRLLTRRGFVTAAQVVSAVPASLASQLGPDRVRAALEPYLRRDVGAMGGAVVVFLGVPESEVADHDFTHHQIMYDYDKPFGLGNNMFVSVSAAGDLESAPAGYRAVMISTHCDLEPWQDLEPPAYLTHKHEIGGRLIALAQRVYPDLGRRAVVCEVATPSTYERYTSRPDGAVGGVRQTLANSNQQAIPYDLGLPGYWLAGDSTWPGLGTVAACLASRHVARGVIAYAQGAGRRRSPAPAKAQAVYREQGVDHVDCNTD